MLVDSHCHVHFPQLCSELPQVLERMLASEVRQAITICTALDEIDLLCDLLDAHAQLFASVGVHPTSPESAEASLDELLASLHRHPKFIAVGESGLDFFHETEPDIHNAQQARFLVHINAALTTGKPLVVHTRNAAKKSSGPDCIDATIGLLAPYCKQGLRAVLHCFTGTLAQAQQALEAGCWLSFTGIVTFRSARDLLSVATQVPLGKLMVETDAPYLAPEPYRGKINEPAHVRHVAQCIATSRGMSLEDFSAATAATTRDFFALPNEA